MAPIIQWESWTVHSWTDVHTHTHAHRCVSFFLIWFKGTWRAKPLFNGLVWLLLPTPYKVITLEKGVEADLHSARVGRWNASKEEFQNIICFCLFSLQGRDIPHAFLGTCVVLKIFEYMNKWTGNFRDSLIYYIISSFS